MFAGLMTYIPSVAKVLRGWYCTTLSELFDVPVVSVMLKIGNWDATCWTYELAKFNEPTLKPCEAPYCVANARVKKN